jgi:uncharacterized repeat protein (TIGR02543 family)
MKKRLLAIIILVATLFTSFPVEAMSFIDNSKNIAIGTEQENKFENPFTDVKQSSWYYDAVQYARSNGFFSGINSTIFAPDGTMNRGMFVTVLARMAGVDQDSYKGQSSFVDVKTDDYYAPFVAWASKHGITTGVGNGKFDPKGLINREQMAMFFIRYFETFGVNYDTGVNITTIPADIDSVSPWARDAVLKLWKTGLLSGDGMNFNPKGNASRAQTATLCMRTDKSVETWYMEPGVPSDRVSIDLVPEQKPDNPNPQDSSDGTSTTINYKISLVVDDTTKIEKLYPKDTLLSTMDNPAQPTGKVFLGWYHDIEKNKPVSGDDRLTGDITLYAKYTDAISMEEGGTLDFVSALDQESNFSIKLKSDSQPQLGSEFNFRDITASEDEEKVSIVVQDSGSGFWTLSSSEGFTPGHTYQLELISDAVIYDDNADVFGDFKVNNDFYDVTKVRFFNFSIAKNGILNLKLNNEIKYIPANELTNEDAIRLMDYAGLYNVITSSEGDTTYAANNGSGSFTYNGSENIEVDNVVAVYKGDKPTERKPEKGNGSTTNDEVSYVKIIAKIGNLYSYVSAEAEDVIFTPDIIPIDIDNGDGTTGWLEAGTEVIVDNVKLDFSDSRYEIVGLNNNTSLDAGDYLAFFTGVFGQDDAQDMGYGEIIEVSVNEDTTIITYVVVTKEDVMSSMELYDETAPSEAEIQALIDENKDEIQKMIEDQIEQSKFFDDAGKYLAEITLQTDEVKEIFGNNLALSDCVITYADGKPIGSSDASLFGSIVNKDAASNKPKVKVVVTPKLAHFTQSTHGLRAEVSVTYNFEIQKKGSNDKIKVNLTAFFEQEITFGFSVDGGIVWKWKWKIIPYISDYRMNGNLDLGTYTGIGITATAKLVEEKQPWGMPWPSSADEAHATKKIFSLGESIKKKMKEVEEIFPKEKGTASGGLAEKYAKFMEDANKDWVDLITVELLDLRGAIDPFHIIAYGLKIDFVVSANLNVAIGMTFQYENYKRHSFTLLLKSKKSNSDTVDLSTNGYQFDFYVMGTIGLRAGVRAKATIGLFSTKLAGIGLQIEAGAYTRMWGYFYYHLENWKVKGVWEKDSSYSGALLVEIGAYMDLKFIAEALNGKYSYAPTLLAKEWPLWSAGQRENVYDFAYVDNKTFDILNVSTYTLPVSVYDMYWMDLKTGKINDGLNKNIKNYDSVKSTGSSNEERFDVELSNPNFSYNPVNNQIAVNTASGAIQQSSQMKLTWKGAPLSGSSETLSRTLTLNWSDEKNAGTIAFESNGGSAVQMLRLLAGTNIINKMPANPTRIGYTFSGWYTDKALNNSFTATTMLTGNTTLYAKWTPNTVSYTVEHYQKSLSGQYELFETAQMSGFVDAKTAAVAKNYTGFKAQTIKQQTIAPDGSTIVAIYYDRNSYLLTLVYGAGSNDVRTSVPYGSAIVKPSNPTKLGYTFDSWDVAIPDYMPANALTITAKWNAGLVRYTVRHIRQNANKSYPTSGVLVETESLTGFTGQSTTATAKTYSGFTPQAIIQKTISPNGSTIVEVKYMRNNYTVSFNGNDSDGGSMTTQNFVYGVKQALNSNNFTRTGYAFNGWNTHADDSGRNYADKESVENLSDVENGSITIYAQWTPNGYTVNFDGNSSDGGSMTMQTFVYDVEQNLTTNSFTRTGYAFNGWNTNLDGSGTSYMNEASIKNLSNVVNGNITLYAQWTASSYTVTFNGNGSDGGSMAIQTFVYDVEQNLTTNSLTKTGYTFNGWNTVANGSGTSYMNEAAVKNLSNMANGNITLYAQWITNGYTVNFDGNGSDDGSMAVQTFVYDVEQNLTTNSFTRTGYTFNGWNTNKDGNGTSYMNEASVKNLSNVENGDVTLYAQWTANSYAVTFDGNGSDGGSMAIQTFVYDVEQNLTTNSFTKTGYTFNGWNTVANGSGTSYMNKAAVKNLSNMANGEITLYAQWEVIKYTVTFDSNKGSGSTTPANPSPATMAVELGAAYGTLPIISRSGYIFTGWYTEASGGELVTETTILTSAVNHTLYAQWITNGYTVNFDGNGSDGGSMAIQTFVYDVEQNLTTNSFTKTGYTFNGWNTNIDGNGASYMNEASVKNLSNMVNGDVTLYAQWEVIKYTVTFDTNKGSGSTTPSNPSPATLAVALDTAYGTLPTISRSGYIFTGWYTEASGGELVTNTTKLTNAVNHTLYARWTPNSYTVSFNGNYSDGGSMATQSFIFDVAQYLTSNGFTRNEYLFNGWNTKADGSGISYTGGAWVKNLSDVTNDDVTLYAMWRSNKITVTFDSNKGSGSTIPSTPDPVSKIVTIGSNYDTLATVSRAGYSFAGWYTSAVGDTKVTDSTTVTRDVNHTLYAKWTANSYTVTFDGNNSDGGSMTMQSFFFDVSQNLTSNGFTRIDYIFNGWNTEKDGSGTRYEGGESVKNLSDVANDSVTLYAQWKYIEDVAKIGTTGYKTLQAAFDAVTEGQTIMLLDNINLNSTPVSFSKDLSFTLDLNGKTLDGGTENAIMCTKGTLIINDSVGDGKVTSTIQHTYFKGTIFVTGTAKLVVAGGRVENTTTHEYVGPAIGVYSTGSVSVTGGTVTSNVKTIAIDSTGSVSISGGTVSSTNDAAIYNFNTGGKITISGTAVITTSSKNYNGSAISLSKGTAGEIMLEITGGTIENAYGTAINNSGEGIISIPSGSPIIKGGHMAMNKAPDLSEYTDVYVTASANVDGSTPVTYNQDNIADYKYLKFEEA